MRLKKLFLLIISLLIFGSLLMGQTPDSLNLDSLINNQANFDQVIHLQSQLATQKLLKSFFLVGFIFMAIMVIFLLYFYHVKIKKILKDFEKYEDDLFIKTFHIAQLSLIVNNLYESVLIIDKDTKIIWGNPAFYKLINSPVQNEVEQQIFFKDFSEDIIMQIEKVYKTKSNVEYKTTIKTIDNKIVKVKRKVIPLIQDRDQKIENFAIIDTVILNI